MILNKIYNFGIRIASAIAGFFISVTFWTLSKAFRLHFRLFGKPLAPVTLKEKGMTAGFINSRGQPRDICIDENDFSLTEEQLALMEEVKQKNHLETAEQETKKLTALAAIIYPCEAISGIKKSYALGAVNGVACRSHEDYLKDKDFQEEHEGKETVQAWVSHVIDCHAKYAAASNHCDDLNNTQDLPEILKFSRTAIAIHIFIELEEALKNAKKKFIHAINTVAEEVKYRVAADKDLVTSTGNILFFSKGQKIKTNDKKPVIQDIAHPKAGDLAFFGGQALKKANEAEGIAEAPYFDNDEVQLASWTAIIQTQVQEELTVAAVRV